jgi:hypothetical protein
MPEKNDGFLSELTEKFSLNDIFTIDNVPFSPKNNQTIITYHSETMGEPP